jgi:hypothetical protein
MVEMMFNHHQPTPITTSTGQEGWVSTAPVEFGGLCIFPSGAELDACKGGQAVMDMDQDMSE